MEPKSYIIEAPGRDPIVLTDYVDALDKLHVMPDGSRIVDSVGFVLAMRVESIFEQGAELGRANMANDRLAKRLGLETPAALQGPEPPAPTESETRLVSAADAAPEEPTAPEVASCG